MSVPGANSMLTVIVGEGGDGEWITWVAPAVDNTTYVAFGLAVSASKQAVYRAARDAGWSHTDLATLNFTWPELRRRAVQAMREQDPIGFEIGVP